MFTRHSAPPFLIYPKISKLWGFKALKEQKLFLLTDIIVSKHHHISLKIGDFVKKDFLGVECRIYYLNGDNIAIDFIDKNIDECAISIIT